jgi:O-antigen/teichoic acid export membrane protein
MQKVKELLRSKIASASALLMLSMTVVNAGNYVYNLIMGRWLGPSLFADLSLIVTLLLIVTFLTAPIQMTAARYSAIHTADGDIKTLASIRRFIWYVALGLGLTLTVFFATCALATKIFPYAILPLVHYLWGCHAICHAASRRAWNASGPHQLQDIGDQLSG